MGGGYQSLNSDVEGTEDDPLDDEYGCTRLDGRNLTKDWVSAKEKSGVKHAFVRTKSELLKLDTNNVDYLLGKSLPYY